jgi:hypothetical protein
MKKPLDEQQQAKARRLVEALRPRLEGLLLDMAEHLVANEDKPFGQPEFDLRGLLHRFGAEALQASLAEKKTATRDVP